MRNKFSNGRLSYFLTPRIHGNVIAWVKSPSQWETEWEKAEIMPKETVGRVDDSGRMLDQRNRTARSNAEAARKQVTNDEPERQRKVSRIVSGNNDSTSHVS